jgi:4'-phosphopantetheinyl transferase
MTGRAWRRPPPNLRLEQGAIHVYRLPLQAPIRPLDELAGSLAADEQARAGRFHFERDRQRYIVTRASLRLLLGRYLARDPAGIRLVYGTQGKPELAGDQGLDSDAALAFNLAHSHELAVCAFARHGRIGIDVEYLRWVKDMAKIAQRFFAWPEYEAWLALPDSDRRAGFFRIWSRKEAFIKALGEGLTHPLDQFVVSVDPAEPARFVTVGGSPAEAGRWLLHDLQPGAGYAGALAADGLDQPHTYQVRCWELAG